MTESSRPRAVFFGTPEFAVPCLSGLCEIANVVLVVTQPDRPSGRGMRLHAPPVKQLALERGIEVVQPRRIRGRAFAEQLRAARAEVAVVVAYGRILPRSILEAPARGCVNVHASLLPRYRGAAPIQWAILDGCERTGVCLMCMDEGMDTGPVLSCESLAIRPEETAGELSARLSALGARLLVRELPRYLAGELQPTAQDDAQSSKAPLLTKESGHVDWSQSARAIADLVRGMSPWPSAFTFLGGERIKLHRAHPLRAEGRAAPPGQVLRADRHGIEVACGQGILVIDELQPAGKRRMSAEQFCAGHALREGAQLETPTGTQLESRSG